jgi:thioredoxin-related protein
MERILIAAVLIAIAIVVAYVLQRRRPDAPTQSSWTVPVQLDRQDFADPDRPWLVVTFTSATCSTCAGVKEKVAILESDAVAVQDVEAVADKALHDRYGIDAVPTLVIADGEGVVRASFVGPVTAADLWATMADLREPGSVPPGCDHGQET